MLNLLWDRFFTIWALLAIFGVGMLGFKNCFGVSSFIAITFIFLVWLDLNYIFGSVWCGGGGGWVDPSNCLV